MRISALVIILVLTSLCAGILISCSTSNQRSRDAIDDDAADDDNDDDDNDNDNDNDDSAPDDDNDDDQSPDDDDSSDDDNDDDDNDDSTTDVFAVGNQTILHYDGLTWSPMTIPPNYYLNAAWGNSARDVFAVGLDDSNNGAVLHYDGSVWSAMPKLPDGVNALLAVWGTSPTNVYATAIYNGDTDWAGVILHYDGAAWSVAWTPDVGIFHSIWGPSASKIFAVGSWILLLKDRLYEMTGGATGLYDGGQWTDRVVFPCLSAVYGTSADAIFVVGNQFQTPNMFIGPFYAHFDGASWLTGPMPPQDRELVGVWASSPTDVYALSDRVLHLDGSRWTTVTDIGGTGIWGRSAAEIYVVGAGGSILQYNGSYWWVMPSGTTQDLTGVWGVGGDDDGDPAAADRRRRQ